MTWIELNEFLLACKISEDQILLAKEFFDDFPEAFVWEDDSITFSIEDEERWLLQYEEDLRREMSFQTPPSCSNEVTIVRDALFRREAHLAKLDIDSIYASLSHESMVVGGLIMEWRCRWEKALPTSMTFDTIIHLAVFPIINNEVFIKKFGDKPSRDDFWIGCKNYCESMNEVTSQAEWEKDGFASYKDYLRYQKTINPDSAIFVEKDLMPFFEIVESLNELDKKFQTLTKERDELEYSLNRNREIAVAIYKLQTMADKDFEFKYKYQWIGIYEVMCEHHLLSDDEKSTFCRICNSPDSPNYFLPEDEHKLPNAYVPGESWEKDSTWHQLSSHGGTPRQRKNIDKTKREFELLLKEHGVI